MFKNYLIVTIRSLIKKKLFVFINILGMGMAVALCIVAYLNWNFRHNWDGTQVNANTIYRVQFTQDIDQRHDQWAISPMPLANYIKQNIKEVKATARFVSAYSNFRIGKEVFTPSVFYADVSFVEMFTLNLKHGDIRDFKNKIKIFISDEVALKYFNREDVVGEQITQINNGVLKEFEIGGVFKKWLPNSSFRFDAITLWDNHWDTRIDNGLKDNNWAEFSTTFLQIENPENVKGITSQLQQYADVQNKARPDLKVSEFYLQNFTGIQEFRIKGNELANGAPYAAVTIPSIMCAMLLLLACFNFMNTSIALSSQRLKEISIRKVMGGVRKQLIFQFLGENIFLCLLGFLSGLLIAEWLVPAYDNLWPWLELDLSYKDNAGILIFLFSLLILTALLAGSYPAFYITSFEPISILKGKTKFGGTNWLTRVLLAAQFSISLVTIIFAVGFYHNAHYQKNYDLGYSTTDVISVWIGNESSFNTYRDALASNENILTIAGTNGHVANSFYAESVKYESREKQVDILEVGDDYLEAVNIKIIAGRGFVKDSKTDREESVLVSEEFLKRFEWSGDVIGKRLIWRDSIQLFVVGVTKNIYARALFQPVEPMMIKYISPEHYQQLVVRVAPDKVAEVNAFMKQKWQQVFPNLSYEAQFTSRRLKDTNDTNNNVIIIFSFLGFFACLMSATGLFTLVSITIMKRIKEIGIRKVLGASMSSIVGVISFEFIMVLLVASLIGGAIGFTMVEVSMDAAWEYYERVGLSTLFTSIGIMIFIAALTVGLKTINAARMNPVKNLRTE